MEGRHRSRHSRRSAAIVVALLGSLAALAGCGGGEDAPIMRGEGTALAARLPSDDALNVAIADVAGIRESLGMEAGAIPPTDDDDIDLVFLDEIAPALGFLSDVPIAEALISEALQRARWVAGVAGDKGVTAFAIDGDTADFEPLMTAAGLTEDGDEWVAPEDEYAVALGDGLVVFSDDPGDAAPVIDNDDDPPEELDQLDGDGMLITLARFGADCVDAIATTDTPGENGEVAFFTTATPDPSKITGDGVNAERTRIEKDSARVSIPAAESPAEEPPALQALTEFAVNYDCDA